VYRQFKDLRDFVDELQPILLEQSADAEARAARESANRKDGG